MSYSKTHPVPLWTLEQGRRFVKSINGAPSSVIYTHVNSPLSHDTEVESLTGTIDFINPHTLVYAL
ncbi:hypothetical protein [Tenacibaculum amylolyticum]|uniref:hypothetical protein n=1 Tax=Tenacibaculum amylolyticum TaxID=104269 RepID=UPI0038B58DBB